MIEDALERAGEHPELDTLVDYLSDTLDEDQDERMRDHLAACKQCGAKVLDLEPLVNPEAPPEGVADLALEVAWKDLKSRMQVAQAPRSAPGAARWPMALAASMLVGVVGLSVWVTELRRSTGQLREQVAGLSRPQVNLPLFYVDELTRSSTNEATPVEVPAEAMYFVLIFSSAEFGGYDSFELDFTDAEGREVLRSTGLELSESGGLRLGLSRDVLPADEYRIRLSALDGGEPRVLEEYRRRISYRE